MEATTLQQNSATLSKRELCAALSGLVAQCRETYDRVAARQSDPGFRGGVEEACLIYAWLQAVHTAFARPFLAWTGARRLLPGGSPGGQDVLPSHIKGVVTFGPRGSVTIE